LPSGNSGTRDIFAGFISDALCKFVNTLKSECYQQVDRLRVRDISLCSVDERLLPFVDVGVQSLFRTVTILFYLFVSLTIEPHPIKDAAT
jgi:hypothetical protein